MQRARVGSAPRRYRKGLRTPSVDAKGLLPVSLKQVVPNKRLYRRVRAATKDGDIEMRRVDLRKVGQLGGIEGRRTRCLVAREKRCLHGCLLLHGVDGKHETADAQVHDGRRPVHRAVAQIVRVKLAFKDHDVARDGALNSQTVRNDLRVG